MAYNPKKWTPRQLEVLTMYFSGYKGGDIAARTGYDPQWVSQLINSDEAKEFAETYKSHAFKTILDVQSTAQAIAPKIMEEKIRLALYGRDERTRSTSCTDILNIAGHRPVNRVVFENRDPVLDKYDNMSEEDLKKEIFGPDALQDLTSKAGDRTLH